jgi:hypothetical protein
VKDSTDKINYLYGPLYFAGNAPLTYGTQIINKNRYG